jgi:hypothetical protein
MPPPHLQVYFSKEYAANVQDSWVIALNIFSSPHFSTLNQCRITENEQRFPGRHGNLLC